MQYRLMPSNPLDGIKFRDEKRRRNPQRSILRMDSHPKTKNYQLFSSVGFSLRHKYLTAQIAKLGARATTFFSPLCFSVGARHAVPDRPLPSMQHDSALPPGNSPVAQVPSRPSF